MIYYIVHVLCLILNPDTGNQNPDPNLRRNSEIDHNIFANKLIITFWQTNSLFA